MAGESDQVKALVAACQQALWHLGTDADRLTVWEMGEHWKTGEIECAEMLRQALALIPRPADGWYPIAHPPHEGIKVDLWVNRQIGLTTGPDRLPDCWLSNGKWWVYDDHGDDQCRSEVRHATHWRYRPDPPAKAALARPLSDEPNAGT